MLLVAQPLVKNDIDVFSFMHAVGNRHGIKLARATEKLLVSGNVLLAIATHTSAAMKELLDMARARKMPVFVIATGDVMLGGPGVQTVRVTPDRSRLLDDLAYRFRSSAMSDSEAYLTALAALHLALSRAA